MVLGIFAVVIHRVPGDSLSFYLEGYGLRVGQPFLGGLKFVELVLPCCSLTTFSKLQL